MKSVQKRVFELIRKIIYDLLSTTSSFPRFFNRYSYIHDLGEVLQAREKIGLAQADRGSSGPIGVSWVRSGKPGSGSIPAGSGSGVFQFGGFICFGLDRPVCFRNGSVSDSRFGSRAS